MSPAAARTKPGLPAAVFTVIAVLAGEALPAVSRARTL
jgi:hypothetical protein